MGCIYKAYQCPRKDKTITHLSVIKLNFEEYILTFLNPPIKKQKQNNKTEKIEKKCPCPSACDYLAHDSWDLYLLNSKQHSSLSQYL